MKIDNLKLFENDTQSISFGPDSNFTLENGTEEIHIYGDISVHKNTPLGQIKDIISIFNLIQSMLENKSIIDSNIIQNDILFFENNTQKLSFGPKNGMSIDNGKSEIQIYGDISISKDTAIQDINNIINVFESISATISKKTIKNNIK